MAAGVNPHVAAFSNMAGVTAVPPAGALESTVFVGFVFGRVVFGSVVVARVALCFEPPHAASTTAPAPATPSRNASRRWMRCDVISRVLLPCPR
jgi:hypothetical protein